MHSLGDVWIFMNGGQRMSEIEVKVANEEELKKWDEFVDSTQMGTIFHKLNLLRAAEKHTKSKLYPLIGYKGNKLVAVSKS